MRNVRKQVEQGCKIVDSHKNIDLTAEDLRQFKDIFDQNFQRKGITGAVYSAICDAFYMGIAVGDRHGRREASRKASIKSQ